MRKGQEDVVLEAKRCGMSKGQIDYITESDAPIEVLKSILYFFKAQKDKKSSEELLNEVRAVMDNLPDGKVCKRTIKINMLLPCWKEYKYADAEKKARFAAMEVEDDYVSLNEWELSYALAASGLENDMLFKSKIKSGFYTDRYSLWIADALRWDAIVEDYIKDPENSILFKCVKGGISILHCGRVAGWLTRYPDLKDMFSVKTIAEPCFDADAYYEDKNPFVPAVSDVFPEITGRTRLCDRNTAHSWRSEKMVDSCEFIIGEMGDDGRDIAGSMWAYEKTYDCILSYKNGDIIGILNEAHKTGIVIRSGHPHSYQLYPTRTYKVRAAKDGKIYAETPEKKERATKNLGALPVMVGNELWDKFICVLTGKRYNKGKAYFLKRDLEENPIQILAELPNDWDGEGARKFSDNLIRRCKVVLNWLLFVPEIFPTGRNSIQFEFEKKDGSHLEIEIYGERDTTCLLIPGGDYEKAEKWSLSHDSEIPDIVNDFFDMPDNIKTNPSDWIYNE